MTTTSQRTLYGLDLALAQLFGAPYECLPNTTLNEKFNIYPNINVTPGSYPTLQYICIGVGGDSGIVDTEQWVYSQHSPIDAALFQHIPFIIRTPEDDLTATEKMKYRFRREEVHNGKTHICYYLKKIPNNLYDQKFFKITTVNGESYLKQHKLNTADLLNPVPRTRMLNIKDLGETEFITKLTRFKLTLSAEELSELEKVYSIFNLRHRRLSEFGLCTGIDYDTGEYQEATCVQIGFHFGMNLDLTYSINTQASVTKYIELGGAEALIR